MNSTTLPTGLRTATIALEGYNVVAINYANLVTVLFGTERPDYDTTQEAVAAWCEAHGAAHYRRSGRDKFSLWFAAVQAGSRGLRRVVLETPA